MVRIRPLPGKLHLAERLIQERPEFIECDKITGDDPFLAGLVVHSIEQMDDVLEALSEHAVTSTAVIKGTSVKRRLPLLQPRPGSCPNPPLARVAAITGISLGRRMWFELQPRQTRAIPPSASDQSICHNR
nr:Lrp/AsnC ligand binding domain-containing protein [Rhizobium sp. NZLR8]